MTEQTVEPSRRFETEEDARRFVAETLKGDKDVGPLVRRSKPARFTSVDFDKAMAERADVLAAHQDGEA